MKQRFPSLEKGFYLFLIFAIIAYLSMPILGLDNVVEEVIEAIIKLWTGKEIDFSPPIEQVTI